MKPVITKTHFSSCILHFALCILLVLLSACGEGSSTSFDEASSETGTIAVTLEWEDSTSERSAVILQAESVCETYGVATVEATVYDQNDNPLKSGGPWACDVHSGTIKGVRAGSNRRVIVLGMDSNDDVVSQGEEAPITVTAGKTTQVEITMNYVGDTLIWDHGNWDDKNWG